MLQFLKRLLSRCLHVWRFESMHDDEIVSSKEFSLQRCEKCNKTKYRKL